jgi:tripartite-type tricarboxylate transporter receptor subunit TctC
MANIMVVNPNSRFSTLRSLIDQEKAKPGSVRFGSAGIGSSGHMAGALLNSIAGIQMQHIPFKGSGPALIDLMGGNIDVIFDGLPSALPHIKSGRLRGVVLLSTKRSSIAPQFPTTADAGVPDFVIGSGTGLLCPKGTPEAVISTLERALKTIADDPKYAQDYTVQGADIDYMTADQYRAFIASETKRTSELGKKAGIVLE